MINYLPRTDLPKVLISALEDKAYSEELSEYFSHLPLETRMLPAFSTTTLPRSARQKALFDRHSHRVYIDPLKNWWKLGGNIVHGLLEKHGDPSDIIEKRFGINLPIETTNIHLHGKPDVFYVREEKIQDYKWTSVWSHVAGNKEEHIAQLNVNALLLRKQGFKVSKLENLLMFRDWRGADVDRIKGYPHEPALLIDQPMWAEAQTLEYVTSRILAHLRAEGLKDDEIPHCTPAERWQGDPLHKVYKVDPKTGVKQKVSKFRSYKYEECVEWIQGNKTDKAGKEIVYIVDTFRASPRKCDFCEIAKHCSQRVAETKEWQEDQLTEDHDS